MSSPFLFGARDIPIPAERSILLPAFEFFGRTMSSYIGTNRSIRQNNRILELLIPSRWFIERRMVTDCLRG